MDTWFGYRKVWAAYPMLKVYAILVAVVFVLAIFGTLVRGPLSILFIPALGGAYAHHLMVQKRLQ